MAIHKFTETEPMRVNKWLAQLGVCSRRKAEELIMGGNIRIDDILVLDVGRKIENGQNLEVLEGGTEELSGQISIAYNKPIGIVSGQPEKGEIPAVRMLVPENAFDENPPEIQANISMPPIGRLDKDSHGLLILSQDGVLAKAIIGENTEKEKEYIVKVAGYITPIAIKLLGYGLELDGRKLKPAIVEQIDKETLRFILREGRNRQIRRMCDLVDLKVIDLLRVRIGSIELGALPEGKWRILTPSEIKNFKVL
jgi:23S rRNA pseudouridine2604 synthase